MPGRAFIGLDPHEPVLDGPEALGPVAPATHDDSRRRDRKVWPITAAIALPARGRTGWSTSRAMWLFGHATLAR